MPTSMQTPGTTTVSPPTYATPAAQANGSWVRVPTNGVAMAHQRAPVMTQPTLGITSNNSMKPIVPVPTASGPVSTVPPYTTGVPTVPFAPPAPLPGTIPTSYSTPAAGATIAAPGTAIPAGDDDDYCLLSLFDGQFPSQLWRHRTCLPELISDEGLIGQPTASSTASPCGTCSVTSFLKPNKLVNLQLKIGFLFSRRRSDWRRRLNVETRGY
jgi:hypothetical protein